MEVTIVLPEFSKEYLIYTYIVLSYILNVFGTRYLYRSDDYNGGEKKFILFMYWLISPLVLPFFVVVYLFLKFTFPIFNWLLFKR